MRLRKELLFGFTIMALLLVGTVVIMPAPSAMTNAHLGLLMLSLVVTAIMLGFPTAFTLMGMGVFFAWLAYRSTAPELAVDQTLDLMVQRAYAVMTNDVLISVPLFVFMGYLVERAALIEKLFKALNLAMSFIPGSLAVATLATCALFATATGIVGAVVTLMGLLAMPAMLRAGYDVRVSAGAITAGGCLGILIPPSVMLILYGATAGVSVVQLYAGAFFPGLMLAGLYILYVIVLAKLKPSLTPMPPPEERRVALSPLAQQLSGGQRRLAVPALLGALGGGRPAGVSAGKVLGQLTISLLPLVLIAAPVLLIYNAVTTPVAAEEKYDLEEFGGEGVAAGESEGGLEEPPADEGGLAEPPAEAAAEPGAVAEPPAEGAPEPAAGGAQEPPAEGAPAALGTEGAQEPPTPPEALGGTPTAQEPAPEAAGSATRQEAASDLPERAGGAGEAAAASGERRSAPLWFWIVAGVALAGLVLHYSLFTFERVEIFKMLLTSFFPLSALIVAVLGAIIFGWATPTEAAALGAAGGMLLTGAYRRFTWSVLKESVFLTAKTTAMVCWLFVGSSIFSAAFALLGGQQLIETWVLGLDMTPLQFMLLAQVIIFLLGWPLEWTEIIVIFMPIFIPLLGHFEVDPLFFGLLVALNLQTAFLSPPVAMAAFYLKGVSPPHVTLNQIFAGMMPYMAIQVLAIFLLYLFPGIGLWLPSALYK